MQTSELGKMAHSDKILRALESAIKHLDGSISALKGKDEDAFSNYVWYIAAELEYALFLFSLIAGNGHSSSSIKPNPELKSLQLDRVMLKVRELISKAQKFIKTGDLMTAHKNAYLARYHVFKVQESLTKKKREIGKRNK